MLSEITVGGENATLPDLYQLNLCVTAVAEGEDGGAVQLEAGDTPEAWDRKRCRSKGLVACTTWYGGRDVWR